MTRFARSRALFAAFSLILGACAGGRSSAPAPYALTLPSRPGQATERERLQQREQDLQQLLGSSAVSADQRRQIQVQLELVRRRLTEGDFRPGDRILLEVPAVPDLPDTLVVEAGPQVQISDTIATFEISLHGLLRSEAQGAFEEAFGEHYLVNPRLAVRPLVELSIVGSVANPGFHWIPVDQRLSQIVTAAGGFGSDADVEDMEIRRAGTVVMTGDEIQRALAEGRTVTDLQLVPGDQIVVPSQDRSRWWLTAALGLTTVLIGVLL